jgi:predicted esterase
MFIIIAFLSAYLFTPAYSNDHVYLFAHGLYTDQSLAYYYENIRKPHEWQIAHNQIHISFKPGIMHTWNLEDSHQFSCWIIQQPLRTFNFPDATRNGFDGSQTSLGQDNEIQALANEYEKIKNNRIILVGMSRGASTILNFLGTRASSSIAAAVIESPFDSIVHALNNFCKAAGVYWIPFSILHNSPNLFFGKFDPKGISPINVVQNINKELPILIVASLEDQLIPARNVASLYYKFLDNGHQHVYFLLLDKGTHAYLLENEDAPLYLNTAHAFYKYYGLPYNQVFAQQGESLLMQCQPTKKIVEEALKNKKSFIQRSFN